VAAALMALAAGCRGRGGEGGAPAAAGTPVVLISIDTLRADHLPAYGYRGVETPAIDALRRDAVLFARAYTHTPLTLPSHTALLTGLLPAETGVRDNVGYLLDAGAVTRHEIPYLPQLLHERGYATGGAVSAYVLQGKTGLATGFDFYEDSIEFRTSAGLGGLQRPGKETWRLARDWLRGAAAKPFLFFFHIYEPHTPYEPPEPYASRYASKYDGEIAAADEVAGEVIAELRRLGVYERAIVVLLSDHGEGLGDHGEAEHGVLLYREAIHVPLLLKLPHARLAGTTIDAPVQLTDVAPTLLALLGLPRPPRLRGAALLAAGGGQAPERRIYSETFYPRLHFGWSDLASLVDRRWHYIEGPAPELYDLAGDPAEKRNLLMEQRRVTAEMRRELQGYDRGLSPPSAVDEETRRKMAALGYIGGGGGGTGAAGVGGVAGGAGAGRGRGQNGALPDPKSRLGTLAELRQGFGFMGRRDYQEAAAAFRRALRDNPEMADAWEFLGHALEKLGDADGALDAYGKALRAGNGSPQVAITVAALDFELGRLDDAEAHARMALGSNPSFSHGLLAKIALSRHDLDTAEREARQASEGKGARIGPLVTLAEVLYARGRHEEALGVVRGGEAIYARRSAKDPDLLQGLNLIAGKIEADLGNAAAAESSFEKEIALFPQDVRAYSNLAILYALTGRGAQASATLNRMIGAAPTAAAYAEAVKTYRVLHDPRGASAVLGYALERFPRSPELRELARR
jgi:arylsulfatase A-like enzyme/tetratricopeptide (TPR) repeat protein